VQIRWVNIAARAALFVNTLMWQNVLHTAGLVAACDLFLAQQARDHGQLKSYTPNKKSNATKQEGMDCLDWSELASRLCMPHLCGCCADYIQMNATVISSIYIAIIESARNIHHINGSVLPIKLLGTVKACDRLPKPN